MLRCRTSRIWASLPIGAEQRGKKNDQAYDNVMTIMDGFAWKSKVWTNEAWK